MAYPWRALFYARWMLPPVPTKRQRSATWSIIVFGVVIGLLAVVLGIAWTARFPVLGPFLATAGVGLELASVLVGRLVWRSPR